MSQSLERTISSVRRRVRRLLLLHALGRVIAIALTVAGLIMLCDYVVHFEDRGIRVIASLSAIGALVWSVVHFLLPALTARFDEVDVALKVEKRFPLLANRLASTIEFLKQPEDDPVAGSGSLRRAVIHQTASEIEALDLRDAVRSAPAARSAVTAAVVCLLFAILFVLNPESMRIAMARLAQPYADVKWPQTNHLAFRDPVRRVALGQTFEVELIDERGAALPEEVSIHYRTQVPGEPAQIEIKAMQRVGDEMVARKNAVARPFAYRAVGGDDTSMSWIDVEVVEPPRIDQLKLTLVYPEYTAWPPAESERHLRALVGTRVEVKANTTKPLAHASIHLEDGRQFKADLTDDGHGFELSADAEEPFVIERSGAYWFELSDGEGLTGESDVHFEIRAMADLPPSVTIEKPPGNLFVTANAVVPLRIIAKDDLDLADVELRYIRSDRSEQGELVESLFEGPPAPTPHDEQNATMPEGHTLSLEHNWDLSAFGLEAGAQLTFHATASDYLPQIGQSPARRLLIVSAEELEGRLDERQGAILGELSRILKTQQESRTGTAAVEIQLGEVGHIAKHDLDQLQGAEMAQRQVTRALSNTDDGIQREIRALLDDLRNNNVKGAQIERRMTDLLVEIEQLGHEHLPTIGRELNRALKRGQEQLPGAGELDDPDVDSERQAGGNAEIEKSLSVAGEHQDAVIDSLEQLLSNLSEWSQYRRLHGEVAAVAREQQQLAEETKEIGRETLSKQPDELSSQQRADLKKLAERQQQLARRFDSAVARMEQIESDVRANDAEAASAIADALHHGRQRAIGGQMRESGERLGQNRLGQAVPSQERISQDLEEMLDILSNRHEHELERLVNKLREAERELADLRERQEGLRKRMQEAAARSDPEQRRRELERLTREQRELEQQASRFARQLRRLQAEEAAASTARAGSRMSRAGGAAESGDGQGAAGQGAQAELDLDDAMQQLAQRRRQAELDLAMEQLAKIEDSILSLRSRQQGVLDETVRLDKLRAERGRFTRAQAASLRALARGQEALENETRNVAEKIKAAKAFELALSGAADQMRSAHSMLAKRDTGDSTQLLEQTAEARLAMLLEALKPDRGKPGENQQGGSGGGGQGGAAPGGGISNVAQLKLIKLMQQQINLQTDDLARSIDSQQPLAAEQQNRLAMLSEEQRRLADLVLDLSRPTADNPEDDPQQLPEMLPEDLQIENQEPFILEPQP